MDILRPNNQNYQYNDSREHHISLAQIKFHSKNQFGVERKYASAAVNIYKEDSDNASDNVVVAIPPALEKLPEQPTSGKYVKKLIRLSLEEFQSRGSGKDTFEKVMKYSIYRIVDRFSQMNLDSKAVEIIQ